MAQLRKGTTYTATGDSSFVTHTNLNAHVDNAKLIGGAIGEQVANPSSTDADEILVNKGGDLFKQTKGEFTATINSNLANINTVNASIVDADSVETIDAIITDELSVGGDASVVGNLAVTGITNLGVLTVDGKTPLYVGDTFYKESIKKIPFPTFKSWTMDLWASPAITVPEGETWTYQVHCHIARGNNDGNTRPETVMKLFLDVGTTNLDTMTVYHAAFGSPWGGYVGVGAITSSNTPTPQIVRLRTAPFGARSAWDPAGCSLVVRCIRQKTADLENPNLYI
jgi:hypothetical protein